MHRLFSSRHQGSGLCLVCLVAQKGLAALRAEAVLRHQRARRPLWDLDAHLIQLLGQRLPLEQRGTPARSNPASALRLRRVLLCTAVTFLMDDGARWQGCAAAAGVAVVSVGGQAAGPETAGKTSTAEHETVQEVSTEEGASDVVPRCSLQPEGHVATFWCVAC